MESLSSNPMLIHDRLISLLNRLTGAETPHPKWDSLMFLQQATAEGAHFSLFPFLLLPLFLFFFFFSLFKSFWVACLPEVLLL